MKDWMTARLVALVLPVVLGPLVYLAMGYVKQASEWVSRQAPATQRILVMCIAGVIAAASESTGQQLPCVADGCTLADLTPTVVKGFMAGLVAMVMHRLKKEAP